MSPLASSRRSALGALLILSLLIAGCGGAESRKLKHLEKGQAFLSAGNLDKARIEFRNALQIAPNDSEARYDNGAADEKLGNIREAAQFYQGAVDADSNNVRARASLARLYLLSGNPQGALAQIAPGLERQPGNVDLLTVRAAARAQLKDIDGALADAQQAVKLAPANEDAVAVLAGIDKAQGRTDDARVLLEHAIVKNPQTVDLRLALAQLYESMGQAGKNEALLLELERLRPTEAVQRLRLAQYYARQHNDDAAEQVLRQGVKDLPAAREIKAGLVQFLAARRGREAAEKELTELIAANPSDYELKFSLGQYYEQAKDYARAEAVYREVIAHGAAGGPGIVARDRLAALRIEQHDVPGAEKIIADVLQKTPRDNDALIMRGNLALSGKDPKSAIVDLRAVLRDQPNSVGVMRSLARAHLANGETALAEETMRRALEVDPKDTAVRMDLAELLTRLGKPEQAKPIIDDLVRQQPDNFQALDIQFKIYAANKDVGGARAAADEMVVLQPKQPLGYFYQGMVAETEKRLDDAARLYVRALDLAPDTFEPLQSLARVLVETKHAPEALQHLDSTMAAYPQAPYAANLKGEVLLQLRQTGAAQEAFRAAIERNPAWPVPYRNLALSQYAAKDPDAAVATLQTGIAKSANAEVLEPELAALYEHLGRNDDAIQVYETALRCSPDSEMAANNLAMLLVTHKRDQRSLDRAKALSARFANSSSPTFLDTYGWVLYKRGEGSAAVAALQTSAAKTPDSPEMLYHLGMAQVLAGQRDAARDSLTRSLQSQRPFAGRDEAKTTLDSLATLNAAPAVAPRS